MSEGISAINAVAANSLYVSTSTNILSALTDITCRRLEEYNINVEDVSSEEEARAIIEQKEAEKVKKNESAKNAETYFDKQIIADAINLSEDLGLFVSSDTDIRTLMENIKDRLNHLSNIVGDNKNMKKVVDEYSNRYDYIYAQYMNKKDFLSNQIITSLDAMSVNGVTIGTNL